MIDVVDEQTRSRIMANIRGRNTGPEIFLRKRLHATGLRFRLYVKGMPGKPDLIFPKFRAVCFVHGCFWHQHKNCQYASVPASRTEYWLAKFENNRTRDIANVKALRDLGWRVAVVWECDLKKGKTEETVARVYAWVRGTENLFRSDGRPSPP